jgi:hypothetical protein
MVPSPGLRAVFLSNNTSSVATHVDPVFLMMVVIIVVVIFIIIVEYYTRNK